MANRKATFAKRQRETDLKDRARAKDARRSQKRNEVSSTKGPPIAWDEPVHAVTSTELPSLTMGNEGKSLRVESPPPADATPADSGAPNAGAAPPGPSSAPSAGPS